MLDVAAGTGALTLAAARTGAHVLATDFSPGMVARIAAANLPNVEASVMDGQALDLADGCFDAVFSIFGVIMFPDWRKGLSEMGRVTRPGGPIAVFLKQRAPDAEAERMVPYEFLEDEAGNRFYAYYTPDEARALFEGAGAEILDVAAFPGTRKSDPMGWVTLLARKPA